jgi:hypothetical protein
MVPKLYLPMVFFPHEGIGSCRLPGLRTCYHVSIQSHQAYLKSVLLMHFSNLEWYYKHRRELSSYPSLAFVQQLFTINSKPFNIRCRYKLRGPMHNKLSCQKYVGQPSPILALKLALKRPLTLMIFLQANLAFQGTLTNLPIWFDPLSILLCGNLPQVFSYGCLVPIIQCL